MEKMYGTTKWLTTLTGVTNSEPTGIKYVIHTTTITIVKISILIIPLTHMVTKDPISEHTVVGKFTITMAVGARSKTITMIPMATSLMTHNYGDTTGMQMAT